MIRSIRIVGNLVWLGLLAGALALPLAAEEITVTIPPDDPPAQAEPAAQPAQPAPQPAASAPLPSYTPGDHLQKSADSSTDAAAPTPPAAPVKHKKKAAATSAAPAADASAAAPAATEAPAAAAPVAADGSAKPAEKPKTAKAASPCLNLDENACGGNSLCIWVAAGTNDAGKATKARCRSLAMLKKEEAKGKAKAAAKGATPEVLPWATNGAAATTPPAEGAATTAPAVDATKPAKKTKTAAVKKTPKPKPETVEATAPPPAQDAAPASAAGSAAEPDPQ